MTTWTRDRFRLSFLLAFLCVPLLAFVPSPTDFSGDYASPPSKSKTDVPVLIHIVQTDANIEITYTYKADGKSSIYQCPLDGTAGAYRTEAGFVGKSRVRWSGKDLLVETLVAVTLPNQPVMRLHTKEKWQLTANGRVLKVHTETDSPDMPSVVTNAAFEASSATYNRVENHNEF